MSSAIISKMKSQIGLALGSSLAKVLRFSNTAEIGTSPGPLLCEVCNGFVANSFFSIAGVVVVFQNCFPKDVSLDLTYSSLYSPFSGGRVSPFVLPKMVPHGILICLFGGNNGAKLLASAISVPSRLWLDYFRISDVNHIKSRHVTRHLYHGLTLL